MDGAEVFAFTIREVPPLVKRTLTAAEWKRRTWMPLSSTRPTSSCSRTWPGAMKVPLGQSAIFPTGIWEHEFPSIPLTITTQLREEISSRPLRLLLAGFGVGYSWGACAVHCGPMVAPPVILVNRSEAWQC